MALFPNALRWRASINLLIFPKKCMFQTSLVLYCSGNENLESSASVILPAENGQTIRESGSPVFLLRGALPTVVLVYQLWGGQWWDLTQYCRSHGGLRAWPASLLSTATCLIIPKDICKCEKQICTVPCWRLRCLPDLRRQPSSYWHPPRVLQRNKVQQETKVSAQLQKGTWVLVFPPQTTLTHSITKASVSKSWIMELSQIH